MLHYKSGLTTEAILNRAGGWFLESGIQEPTGGVARYYRSDLEENHAISTEITGYAISTLLHLHKLRGKPELRAAAGRAANFLLRLAWNPKLCTFPFEMTVTNPQPEALACFFDCGIIVRGLLDLWRMTRDEELLDVSIVCARSMKKDFAAPDGSHPILRLPDKSPVPRDDRWSRNPGCYQLKASLAWFNLFEATGDEQYLEWYEEAVEQALSTHESFLAADPDPDRLMDRLHPYLYFLEGLLPRIKDPRYAPVIRHGIGEVTRCLRKVASRFVRSDVYAQLLRMRLWADAAGAATADRLAAEEEAESLAQFSIDSVDMRVKGGFHFGRRAGEWLPHVNPASTAFAVQALEMWREFRHGELRTTPAVLI